MSAAACDTVPEQAHAGLSRRMRRVSGSAIMELLKLTAKGNYISFASGLPDASMFPAADIARISEEVLSRDGRAALQYGAAEGYGPLRATVAEMLRKRGLSYATPEHILITNGSEQALDLASRALLDPGDRVLIERPTYLAALQTFDSCEAEYVTVPMDDFGMDTAKAARQIAASHPKLAFALPNFQNPSGLTMPLDRRIQLAEACATAGIALIEDDAYYDLRYEGESLPPISALARNPRAIYTGTFSKTIAPGLRVGYLYAEPALTARLTQLKQISDLHTGSLTQRIVARFCDQGLLEPHIGRLVQTYGARRCTMLAALDAASHAFPRKTRPRGGMFVLAWLPEGADASNVLPRALERGVVFVPAAGFFAGWPETGAVRLNFVSADEDAIRRGIALLADAVGS